MPQTGYCTDVTCSKELTELYECHCCTWLVCLKHLLEHVEISKRERKEQLNTYRNGLISVSNTLELIVEKKIHKIEREKQLLNQAKIILEKSAQTIEEIELVSEEINQAIISNRKEETIVKVESSLFDIENCSLSNEIIEDKSDTAILYSTPSSILQQPQSPVYRALRSSKNLYRSEGSTTAKSSDQSTNEVDDSFDKMNKDDQTMNSTKDEANDDEYDQENSMISKDPYEQCPLTFDGAFGLTKAIHSIVLCPIDDTHRRNLYSHFQHHHKLKKSSAHRLSQAVKSGQDPQTAKLFSENEIVIDYHRDIPCPFSSSMIHLIGSCPSQSRNIPCSSKSIGVSTLVLHLKQTHRLSTAMARKINKSYKIKLSKLITSNDNNTMSY